MEGSVGKMVNVKAKALTVEKTTDNKEQSELKKIEETNCVIGYNNERCHSR